MNSGLKRAGEVTWLRQILPLDSAGRADAALQIHGPIDIPVESLVYDSRRVTPGALFFALPGTKMNGTAFLEQALDQGARAIVAPPGMEVPSGVTVITSENPRRLLGAMADQFYHRPSERLTLIGVTGTSGKTTTTYVLEAIGKALGWTVGVIGTVNYRYADQERPAPLTTPEAVELQALLYDMVRAGVSHVIMEVSSHALAQDRVWGCRWDGAVFTNLGRDHLDYHLNTEAYFAAKARLFRDGLAGSPKRRRFAVINADDTWGQKLLAEQLPYPVLTYSIHKDTTVSVQRVNYSLAGIQAELQVGKDTLSAVSPLIGEPHVYNILAAATVAHALGASLKKVGEGIAHCRRVPGRLEALSVGQQFEVFVDYAHKPDALERALASFRALTSKRLITVFGCGGDRDRGKRPLMGEVAGRLSDVVVLTSDNPRTENPDQILTETEPGLSRTGMTREEPDRVRGSGVATGWYMVIADRRSAIRRALDEAQPGDVVVIAGKGHEDYQIMGTTQYHFDDAEEVRHYLSLRRSSGQALEGGA